MKRFDMIRDDQFGQRFGDPYVHDCDQYGLWEGDPTATHDYMLGYLLGSVRATNKNFELVGYSLTRKPPFDGDPGFTAIKGWFRPNL